MRADRGFIAWLACFGLLTSALLPSALLPSALAARAADDPVPVIIDTEIGSDLGDPLAIGLALAAREQAPKDARRLEVLGITTSGSAAETRAWMICRMLTATGHDSIPVAAGADPQPERPIGAQAQYRHHPDVIFNRTTKPKREPAHELIYSALDQRPGEITLLVLGPLTNVARLLVTHADAGRLIKRIVFMGGAVEMAVGAGTQAKQDFRSDPAAARRVLSAGVPLTWIPIEGLKTSVLVPAEAERMLRAGNLVSDQVRTLDQLSDRHEIPLVDAAGLYALMFPDRVQTVARRLEMGDDGSVHVVEGKSNVEVVQPFAAAPFEQWVLDTLANPQLARAKADGEPKVRLTVVPRGGLPLRVHACEDFETDIERRWWMAGLPDRENVPENSKRACRGVLTHDFDDLMGNRRAMYTAVIFNPVPGPPMSGNTRLAFRYRLHGSDRLRVQIYSLTNGYHRCGTLVGLSQDAWHDAAVDMTQLRRPDGSGGPLSADERIDDIQFYADKAADLSIDDIVLYEAAAKDQQRPFPSRILFTAGFDTGKQGVEWPGRFELVPQSPPLAWKAAKSLADPASGEPVLRVGLRGQRALDVPRTRLDLRYRLSGADKLEVRLNGKAAMVARGNVPEPVQDKWSSATVEFAAAAEPATAEHAPMADDIEFVLPKGAELWVDDLLLYEP